jgi:AmmeMemoRadiSam system protein B
MNQIRSAVVAGRFYPGQADQLRSMVLAYLQQAGDKSPRPKALIAPHASYLYSGPIAASAYVHLLDAEASSKIERVVLVGPSHFVPVDGVALSSADAFVTPLGAIPVDQAAVAELLTLPQVQIFDEAHAQEHSLEVHLPFLQCTLPNFSLIPMTVGEITLPAMMEVLEQVWGGAETLIVISSDLSHYLDYDAAKQADQLTSRAIEALQPDEIGPKQACGRHPIRGLLTLAHKYQLTAKTVDLRNSGDTAGPRDRVVGYGGFVFV